MAPHVVQEFCPQVSCSYYRSRNHTWFFVSITTSKPQQPACVENFVRNGGRRKQPIYHSVGDVEEDGLVLPLDAEKEEVDEEKENVEAEKEEKTLRRKYHENIFFY